MDLSGHIFVSISFNQKMKSGLISSDSICNKCGIIVNAYYYIIDKNWKTGVHIDKYELSCNEVMIKRLIE